MKKHKFYIRAVSWMIGCSLLGGITFLACNRDKDRQGQQVSTSQETDVKQQAISNQYIVTAKEGQTDVNAINAKLQQKGLPPVDADKAVHSEGAVSANMLNLTKEQYEALKDDKTLHVEQDRIIALGIATTSGNISLTSQYVPWGVKSAGGAGNGVGKTAWIIDSGVELDHPDLTVDVTRSKSFVPATAGGKATSPTDEYGHGTNVAGIVAAKNNSIGVVGIAAGATVVSVKVLDYLGRGTTSRLYQAVNYVTSMAKAGDVCNISIAAGADPTLDMLVKNLGAKGVFVTTGAGNSSCDCGIYSPQRVNALNVYTVSGMDSTGIWLPNSNFGKSVDYCGPAKNVTTTALGKTYKNVGGTSMASPHLAGILLMTGGKPRFTSYVKNDPDMCPDPIPNKQP